MAASFGDWLRHHRLAAGLSQNELARQVGVDPAHVNRLEKGIQIRPGRPVTLQIAHVLGLDAAEADRFLFAAGLAPQHDWQTLYEELEAAIRTVRGAANTISSVTATVRMRRAI